MTPSAPILHRIVPLPIRLVFAAVLLAFTAKAQSYEVLHSFSNETGSPLAAVIEGTDGSLYGTASGGGLYGYGSVFKLTPDGNGGYDYTTLHSFDRFGDGAWPSAALVEASDGNFYGTTFGGTGGAGGSVFRINSDGDLTTLHEFSFGDGYAPQGALVTGSDGSLYGTASAGGAHQNGAIFRIDQLGNFTTLHSFTDAQGERPQAGLFVASDGFLYGTTALQGANSYGTIFRTDEDGNVTVVYDFTDGQSFAALLEGSDTKLYGTSANGGANLLGSVFRVGRDGGDFTVLHSFAGADGSQPSAAFVVGSDGKLYGTTTLGGTSGLGTVFRIDSLGNFDNVLSFAGPDGSKPVASLLPTAGGDLLGVAMQGGHANFGTVFRLDSLHTLSTIHHFAPTEGTQPAPLVMGTDGNLYGTSVIGGDYWGGTVYRMDLAGNVTTIHSFAGGAADGRAPYGLVAATDGLLYGTTAGGGPGDAGAFYRMDLTGSIEILYMGSVPLYLIQGGDGYFYGVSNDGDEVIVRFDTSGNRSVVYPFPVSQGASSQLTYSTNDGKLYGVTAYGGAAALGTVFRVDVDGSNFTVLHEFSGFDGSRPVAGLVEVGVDFFGTAFAGGAAGAGTAFRITPEGGFTLLYVFGGASAGDGAFPMARMIQGLDGNLYGTASSGAAGGIVFRLGPSGDEALVHLFGAPGDGESPQAALLPTGDGALYGTTVYGGAYAGGTTFKLVPETTLSVWGIAPGSAASTDLGPGGLNVVISGFHFQSGATASIGGLPAITPVVSNEFVINSQLPVLPPGTLNDLTITNPDNTFSTLVDAFFVDFDDVSQFDPFHAAVESVFRAGVSAGCGNGLFCRDAFVRRAQMAVLLLKAKFGPEYVPLSATGQVFADVPADAFAAAWIEDLAARGVTAGCGNGNYCPDVPVSRAQMAVFLLKTLLGSAYAPPPPSGTVFDDVPAGAFAAAWIEDLASRGITSGCSAAPPLYCPASFNTRGQMAVFLTATFHLP